MPEPDMGVPEPDPGCGNGIVEAVELDELCDDGNLVDGDGCSAACIPSGTLIDQSLWPAEPPHGVGVDLAKTDDGYVALARRFGDDDVGSTAVVLGLDPDAVVTWSGSAAGATAQQDVWPEAFAVDPTGVIVAVGVIVHDQVGDDLLEPWIGRFEPDGTPTWSFSEPTAPAQRYFGVAIAPSGDPIAVGSREIEDGTFRLVVRRHAIDDGAMVWELVDADDTGESAALSAAITNDGELLVAGWRAAPSGRDLWLGRFDEDGVKLDDTGFAEPLTSYYANALAIDASGDAIICGSVVRASAQNALIGRFTLGAADPKVWMQRIEPPGPGASGCGGLAIDDEGRVAIGGYAFDADESYEHMFARLSADGEILWTGRLGEHMGYSYDATAAIVLDSAGDIVAVGTSEDAADDTRVWIGRVTG
jgi:cysteine-rich repeat protein